MRSALSRLFCLVVLVGAFASQNGRAAGPLDALPAGVSPQTTTLQGQVLGIDPICKTIKITDPSGPIDLLVKEDTEIVIDGELVKDMTLVQPGYSSTTYFRNNGDAARIVITSH